MELFFLIFFFALIVGLGAVGLWKGNPWLTILACVFAVGLGALVLSSDLILPKVDSYDINDANSSLTIVTPNYAALTPENDPLINSFGYLLFVGGIIFGMIAVYYATLGREGKVFE